MHIVLGQDMCTRPFEPHVHSPIQPVATPKPAHAYLEPLHGFIPHRLLDKEPEAPLLGKGHQMGKVGAEWRKQDPTEGWA